jgi:hypothetical protein
MDYRRNLFYEWLINSLVNNTVSNCIGYMELNDMNMNGE